MNFKIINMIRQIWYMITTRQEFKFSKMLSQVGMNYYNSRILMGKLILWWEKSDTKGTDYRTKSSNRDSSSGNEKVAWSGHLLSFDQTKKEIISYVRICSSFSFFIFRFIS